MAMKRQVNENQHTEWKQSWRDEYLKWICGFANADGGVLEIGRDDSGTVVGLTNALKLLEDIPNKIRDILGIVADVNLCSENGLDYLQIVVEPYPYPISYKGEYHYRSGSTKQELKGAALDKFLLKKQGLHWDGVPVPDFSIDDLSPAVFKRFRELAAKSKRLSKEILAETDENLIRKLRLFTNDYLKRAAVLLFHEDPEVLVGGAYIKIGFFRNNVDLLYQDEIHGDLFSQVEKTMDLLLTKYLRAGISYDGLYRNEKYPMPEEALREVLVNAVAHKDYATSVPIQISVYDDKLMIWNPGQLPMEWTVEKLFVKHESHPHNPEIANAFFRTALMESWGRSYEKITEACNQTNCPLPTVKYERTGLWVTFEYPEIFIKKISTETSSKTSSKATSKATSKTTSKTTSKQDAVLEHIRLNPNITAYELSQLMGLSEEGIRFHLKNLKKFGIIKRFGSSKTGHWEIISDNEQESL